MGFTLNLVTLSAMTMGVGMMVDNSIVVMDSIFKSNSQGKTPMEAAVDGTKFVMGSIIGSTITTVVVFLPLAFISGMADQMFTPLGFTITFSLVASLFSAITLVPLFFVQFKPREKHKAPAALFLKKLERGYGKLLKNILNKKKTVIVCVLAFMVLSVFLALQLNVEMLPATDEGIVNIEVEMRPGLRLEKADEIMLGLEEMIAGHPDLDHYITTVKAGGSNSTITAYLQDHRKTETTEVVEQWRNESKGVMNCNISINASSSTSSTSSNDNVEIKLKGNDLNTMKEFAGEVEAIMTAHPDIITVSTDLESGNPQAKIVVDPVKASALGLTPSQVSSSISMAINGSEAATLRRNGHDYSIQVEYPAGRYEDMTKLRGMVIVSSTGASVPLMDIVSIEFSNAPSTIKKENNQYIVTVNGTPKTVAKYSAPSEIKAQVKALQFPEGVELAESSSMESMMEEFTGIIIAIVIAILLVFLVMTIQFESFKHSLMVMLCIPFSLIGSFTFLFVARATISIISLLGFLILIGTVVNNGILFVDTTNEYRRSMDLQTALIHTGRHRLRPILLTTLTTVLSMIPLALAIGEGADMMQGLGIVVIGGLSASTLLTLLFLPTFYLIIDGNSEKKRRREKRRRMKEEKSEQMMA